MEVRFCNLIRIKRFQNKGFHIGHNVRIGKNVRIEAETVEIGDDVFISDNTTIRGKKIVLHNNVCIFQNVYIHVRELLDLGEQSKVSKNCVWKANTIVTGRNLWCNENVEIGGGGWNNPRANLTIGPFMHIGRDVQINVCEEVTMEGYSGVGIGSMIFTHSAGQGQSILDGYSFVEAPVYIGKNVSLFTSVIVSPGTRVENGVTVAAQSFIRGNLEEYSFYAGTPAKQKKKIHIPDWDEKWQILMNLGPIDESGKAWARGKFDGVSVYYARNLEILKKCPRMGILVILNGENNLLEKKCHIPENICVINFSSMSISGHSTQESEGFRDMLRRHGIILTPVNGYQFNKLNPDILKEKSIEV